MELFLSQILNGLAIGQVYALIALGFSLIFGVANIINFAQGSLFMLGAFVAFSGLTVGLPLPVAAALSIGVVSLLSLSLERVTLRPLVGSSYMAPFLSTLAIATIIDQGAEIIWSPQSQPFPALFADVTFYIGNAYVTGTDLGIFSFGAAATIGLSLFLARTWTGRALRATAQDTDAATQMGVRTDRANQFAFGLSGALAALSGVLVAFYFQSVFPQMGLPFGLKGFAAALIGGLGSMPGAVLGGLFLGVAEALASGYVGDSYRDAIAYSLLLIVLLARPQGLLGKRTLEALGGAGAAGGSMPTTSLLAAGSSSQRGRHAVLFLRPRWLVLLGAALALVPLLVDDSYLLQAFLYGLIFALLAASVSLVSGAAGVLSLGHAAFFGVGAYAVALLARPYGLPVEATLLIAGLGAGAVATIAAIPLLRLSGHTVALGTLAIGQIGFLVFLNWVSVTRGPMGILNIPAPHWFFLNDFSVTAMAQRVWFVLFFVTFGLVVMECFVSSEIGRVWRAIREDRLAAQTAGVPVKRYLLLAFAVSGVFAGLAGGLFAYVQTVVSPESFNVDTSILVLTMAVLGGLGNITGAALAGFGLAVVPEFLRGFEDYRMIVYGALLLIGLRVRPIGLLGAR